MSTITERVAAGAAFLDEKLPGWVDRIDLDILDIDSCPVCIVGQLYGPEYDAGITAWGLTSKGIPEGFWPAGWSEVDDLTAEWKHVITARRSSLPATTEG